VLAATAWAWGSPASARTNEGITDTTIRIGGVMDLQGDSRGLGQGMKAGIDAALAGQSVHNHRIVFDAENDNYTPEKTVEATRRLIDQGVFAMLGNVGTPTAKVSLPILAKAGVPAVGFFTGAGLLRPGVGDVLNFRASYVQETARVINSALSAGMHPQEVCAYVQNDSYGMAGVEGIKEALSGHPGTADVVALLDRVIHMQGDDPARNNLGPVGVYERNTLSSREGYLSLKNWERSAGTRCRLVVSVGTYAAVARFVAYSRYKGDDWLVSAVSFTGADNFRNTLHEFNVRDDRVLMTQVVPPLDSSLPIVTEARAALGDRFGYVSLEGYIVGRMLLHILNGIKGDITRESFLAAARGAVFDLGGLHIDFSHGNQGSDFVLLTRLDGNRYRVMTDADWSRLLAQ